MDVSSEWHRHRSRPKRYRTTPKDDLIPTVCGVQSSFHCKDIFRTTKHSVYERMLTESVAVVDEAALESASRSLHLRQYQWQRPLRADSNSSLYSS
jgi:hypothetical protein